MFNKRTHARLVELEWEQHGVSKKLRAFTCHHVQRLQLPWVRRVGDVGSPSPSQHQPAPTLSASEPHSCLSTTATLRWSWLLHPETGQHPSYHAPNFLSTILNILATAGLQMQSQAGVTPCHSMSPPPGQWQQAGGAAFLSPTASFLPLAAHKRAGSIRTLCAAGTLRTSDSREQREPCNVMWL